ncbi:hypothetical protein T11_8217 [Trichinella zimbabwensis]|uniref:Uncharacterized protein n=1 Tax=Trichinella zimbabwensis TaxID=268475 RepID=A0A0V1GAI6_9BILA|nr:hypothetical protein T11_8217 [Trichinella zimbabwensis]
MRKNWIAQNKEILHKTAQLHRILQELQRGCFHVY